MGKKIASLILVLAGVIFFAMPLKTAIKSVYFRKNGVEATGRVTDIRKGSRSGPDRVTIAFTTALNMKNFISFGMIIN